MLDLADRDGPYMLIERLQKLDVDEETLMLLGSELFDAIFQGTVRDVYTRSQGALTAQQSLRIRLHFVANEPRITALPWEFMYDPHQGPLALLDTPIVRFLPQQDKLPTLAAPLPLRILLTAAQTPPAINIERELSAAHDALAPMADRVEVLPFARFLAAAVRAALRELEALGATLVDVSLPRTELAIPVYYIIAPADAS